LNKYARKYKDLFIRSIKFLLLHDLERLKSNFHQQ
jgi:hypothetical protein